MSEFVSSTEAFRVARERASVAAAFVSSTLHSAIYDGREAGLSIREVAATLHIPKSTVARHWKENHRCTQEPPLWGSEESWREAHAAIWAHNPKELADSWIPYEWIGEGASRIIKQRHRGVAKLRMNNDQ